MMLEVALHHRLGAFTLDVAFTAPAGVTVLFGRSGSGKTSIANAVAGLLRAQTGRVVVAGRVLQDSTMGLWLPPHKRRIGYVFQDARLFPHLSVRQNLLYGQRFAPAGARFEDEGRIIALLGLETLLARRPGALSGGERQRVALGRALLSAPELVIADEPLAALDEARKAEILPYFERLRDAVAVPVLYVSHSAAEVARLATQVVAVENGRVTAQGSAAVVLGDPGVTPLGAREAGAVIEATLVRHHDDGLSELEAGGCALFLPRLVQAPGARLRVRIAAHDVILSLERPVGLSALNILPGVVHEVRAGDGPGAIVALDTPAGRVLARITQRSARALGLAPGIAAHAVIKSVSVAPADVGAR